MFRTLPALLISGALLVGCNQVKNTDGPTASATAAAKPVQIGEQPAAFYVNDITGPSKGESLCYRCKYSGKPTIAIFTRSMNDSVTSLVKEIDKKVGENEEAKLSAFVVVVGEDSEKMKPELERLQVSEDIQNTPMTVFSDSKGPEGYGVDAPLQVMMWNSGGMKVIRPFQNGELSKEEVSELVAQTGEILN